MKCDYIILILIRTILMSQCPKFNDLYNLCQQILPSTSQFFRPPFQGCVDRGVCNGESLGTPEPYEYKNPGDCIMGRGKPPHPKPYPPEI